MNQINIAQARLTYRSHILSHNHASVNMKSMLFLILTWTFVCTPILHPQFLYRHADNYYYQPTYNEHTRQRSNYLGLAISTDKQPMIVI